MEVKSSATKKEERLRRQGNRRLKQGIHKVIVQELPELSLASISASFDVGLPRRREKGGGGEMLGPAHTQEETKRKGTDESLMINHFNIWGQLLIAGELQHGPRPSSVGHTATLQPCIPMHLQPYSRCCLSCPRLGSWVYSVGRYVPISLLTLVYVRCVRELLRHMLWGRYWRFSKQTDKLVPSGDCLAQGSRLTNQCTPWAESPYQSSTDFGGGGWLSHEQAGKTLRRRCYLLFLPSALLSTQLRNVGTGGCIV